MGPAWWLDRLAALMLIIAFISAARLAIVLWPAGLPSMTEPSAPCSPLRSSGETDADIANLLMWVAMAGMLSSSLQTLSAHGWEMIFGLFSAWFAWRGVGDIKANGLRSTVRGHRAVHLIHCAATAYMFAAASTSGGRNMIKMDGDMSPTLKWHAFAWAFALAVGGYCIRDLIGQLAGHRLSIEKVRSPDAVPIGDNAPAAAGRVLMGVTMVFMLVMN